MNDADNEGTAVLGLNHYKHSSNYTIHTSVTIRVTPYYDHLISWAILWGCLVVTCLLALWQVLKERKILLHGTRVDDVEHAASAVVGRSSSSSSNNDYGGTVSTALITRVMVRVVYNVVCCMLGFAVL